MTTVNNTEVIAVISILLYFSVSLRSGYLFLLYFSNNKKTTNILSVIGTERWKKIAFEKRVFFVVLAISALMDAPFYIACAWIGKDNECFWTSPAHSSMWCLHLLAMCGYTYCLGIPLTLIDEIAHGLSAKCCNLLDGDLTIIFCRCCTFLYIIVQVTTIIAIIATGKEDFRNLEYSNVANILESIVVLMTALGWFFVGLRLQSRIKKFQFSPIARKKLIWTVNIIMLTITINYFIRSLLLFLKGFKTEHHDAILTIGKNCPYFVWVACTRWSPYVFSSHLLLYVMQQAENTKPASATLSRFRDVWSTEEPLFYNSDEFFSDTDDGLASLGDNSSARPSGLSCHEIKDLVEWRIVTERRERTVRLMGNSKLSREYYSIRMRCHVPWLLFHPDEGPKEETATARALFLEYGTMTNVMAFWIAMSGGQRTSSIWMIIHWCRCWEWENYDIEKVMATNSTTQPKHATI